MPLITTYHSKPGDRKRPVRERYFVNERGEKDGLYQRYYMNGQPAQTCTYRNGKKNGVQVSRYENGRISSECTYRDGDQEGSYTSYYPDGTTHQTCYFINDKYEGECRLFNPDGSLASVYTYHEGLKDGVCEVLSYDEQKNLIKTERQICKGDQIIRSEQQEKQLKIIRFQGQEEELYETFHENGKTREQFSCIDGHREGRYIRYDLDASLLEDSTYKQGKLEGMRTLFYPGKKGIMRETCEYKDGEPDGLCVRYDEEGSIIERCQYKQGKKVIYPEMVQNLFMKTAEDELRDIVTAEILDARRSGDMAEAIQIAKSFHQEKTDVVRRTALKFKDQQKCRT